ncbi:hypothetical protein Cgig2_007502 [Carnegiea gigantea]|uniref:Uncharacterized protein n=1 Tax=Carnegiea gigantea TaxID=171969 RepID=A0A9Q1JVL0_9CARY|nr:hypothetical protein Cgig2_007502 [Carnegiea gigantea]
MASIWTRHHWMKEYNEASRFADDVNDHNNVEFKIGTRASLHCSTTKYHSLEDETEWLEIQLFGLYGEHTMTKEEMKLLKDILWILRSKTNQMEVALSTSNFPKVDCLIGLEIRPVDTLTSTSGLDEEGTLKLQQQIIRGKLLDFLNSHLNFPFFQVLDYSIGFGNDALDELEEIVLSTKHVALAMNEELGLHRRPIDTWDYNAETRSSRIQVFF